MNQSSVKSFSSLNRLKRSGLFCKIDMVNDNYYLHKHNYIEVSVIMKGRVSHELNGVFDILERGGNILSDDESISMFISAGVIVAGLGGIGVCGVRISVVAATIFCISFFAAPEKDIFFSLSSSADSRMLRAWSLRRSKGCPSFKER